MKFERVRPGEYRAEIKDEVYIWISREWPRRWWWFIGNKKGVQEIWAETNGPFPTPAAAIADAVATYEEVATANKIVWWVHRPTYTGGRVKPAVLWRLQPVIAGSERDERLVSLAAGRIVNDSGEFDPLPGQWIRFDDKESADAWLRSETGLQWD
jgi:hypothetical protein